MTKNNHCYMIYARVSPKGSDWHAEETSISMQIQEMKDYILRKDPAAEFLVQQDEFKSGKNLNRPGIQTVLADLELPEPPWSTLVVWALDRLSRSLADAVPIFEKLRDAGCGFICVRQDYLSTQGAMARFTLNQTILIAQLEREMTSERVKAKMVYIAEKGKIPAGKIPLGYRRKKNAKNEIEPDPETADIVKDIFKRYLAKIESVADLKRRYSNFIYGNMQLYRMLRNRLYIGEVEYDGKIYPGRHDPIIDRAVFDAVQNLLPGERRAPRPGRQIYKYLLQGLVFCECGKKMVPYSVKKSGNTRYFYYKCQDTLGCKYAINAERLDAEVMEQVLELAADEKYLKARYTEWRQSQLKQQKAINDQIKKSETAVSEAKNAVAAIDNLFLTGVVTTDNAAYWNEKLTTAREHLSLLESKHKTLLSELTKSEDADFPSLLHEIRRWSDLLTQTDDYNIKRNLILTIVKHVQCIDRKGKTELKVMIKGNKWRRVLLSNPRCLKPGFNLKIPRNLASEISLKTASLGMYSGPKYRIAR